MAVETARRCGYRKVGGLYMVCDGIPENCERVPIPITPCVVCGESIKQIRSFQWVRSEFLLSRAAPCQDLGAHCGRCPLCTSEINSSPPEGKVGLIWIGEKFYPSPADWLAESRQMGVSRRISMIPREFVIGRTYVFAAHPRALNGSPGVIFIFLPTRIELIVTPSMKESQWARAMVNRGVTLVEVPENDPDHALPRKRKSAREEALRAATSEQIDE